MSLSHTRDRADVLHEVVATLINQSGKSQRELVQRAGLSKDQISRALSGSRSLSSGEALALLEAAELPARGALTLALFGRQDLAQAWTASSMAAFFETLISALPDAFETALGESADRIDPRWGRQAARFVAQRIAHHVSELIEREERLGEFQPPGSRGAA